MIYYMKNSRGRTAMTCVLSARRRRVVSGARKIKYIPVKVGKSLKSIVQEKKTGCTRGGVVEKLKSSPGEEKYGGSDNECRRRRGGGVDDDCVYSRSPRRGTLRLTSPRPRPFHRSHPPPTHRKPYHYASTLLRHAAPRRSVAMDTRNDVTGNTPHQSRPAPPPATIATT